MKLSPRRFFAVTLVAGLALLSPTIAVGGVSVQALAQLGGSPEGFNPQAPLILGSDGDFYGTTPVGGPSNRGTAYKISAAGKLTILHAFTGGTDGAAPMAALVSGPGGDFYGTASAGGTGGEGVIFKITPAGGFKVLHSFGALDDEQRNVEGSDPEAPLIVANGNLYGTAHTGGSTGAGTVFRVTPAGAVKVLYTFGRDGKRTSDGLADGAYPRTALVGDGSGNFYGTTSASGKGYGTVFRVSAAGVFDLLYSFTGGADGSSPSNLTESGGAFYGTTGSTFFTMTKAGRLTTLHTFSRLVDGSEPSGLTAGPAGLFYGTTSVGGPNDGYGTIFEMTTAGAATVLYTFGEGTDGAGPEGAPVLAGNALYGVANFGGIRTSSGNSAGGGTVYQFQLTGTIKTLHVFAAGGSYSSGGLLLASNGFFYGTLADGGALGGGSVFAASPVGVVHTVHNLDPDTEGARPKAALVEDQDGTIYGTASAEGPEGGGGVFSFLLKAGPVTSAEADTRFPKVGYHIFVFQNLLSMLSQWGLTPDEIFDVFAFRPGKKAVEGGNDAIPRAAAAGAGTVLYGINQTAGANGDGSLFSLVPGEPLNILHSFGASSDDGYLPEGLTRGKDGSFYGTTYGGGTKGFGTVFTISTGGTYRTLHSFAGTGDGVYPLTGLTPGNDGNLYGTTSNDSFNVKTGETSGNGTIFAITPGGDFKVLHKFAKDSSDGGGGVTGELVQVADGTFYGATSGGGDFYEGTIFSITPGGKFTSLYSFSGDTTLGGSPMAPLALGSDGDLYGTTSYGDILFKVSLDAKIEASLTANFAQITAGTGGKGEVTLALSAAPTSTLTVDYKITGSAKNGKDYELLSGKVVFMPGKSTATLQVVPLGTLGGASMKTVTLTLLAGNGYTVAVGGSAPVTVTILGP